MNATDYLRLVFTLLPVAFFADLLAFTFGVWWIRRWRRARAFRRKMAPYSLHR